MTPNISIFVYLPLSLKFMKPCRTNIKLLYAFQQDIREYAGNLIYGVRLQMDVGNRLAETLF